MRGHQHEHEPPGQRCGIPEHARDEPRRGHEGEYHAATAKADRELVPTYAHHGAEQVDACRQCRWHRSASGRQRAGVSRRTRETHHPGALPEKLVVVRAVADDVSEGQAVLQHRPEIEQGGVGCCAGTGASGRHSVAHQNRRGAGARSHRTRSPLPADGYTELAADDDREARSDTEAAV